MNVIAVAILDSSFLEDAWRTLKNAMIDSHALSVIQGEKWCEREKKQFLDFGGKEEEISRLEECVKKRMPVLRIILKICAQMSEVVPNDSRLKSLRNTFSLYGFNEIDFERAIDVLTGLPRIRREIIDMAVRFLDETLWHEDSISDYLKAGGSREKIKRLKNCLNHHLHPFRYFIMDCLAFEVTFDRKDSAYTDFLRHANEAGFSAEDVRYTEDAYVDKFFKEEHLNFMRSRK